jgi:hypothetical protein
MKIWNINTCTRRARRAQNPTTKQKNLWQFAKGPQATNPSKLFFSKKSRAEEPPPNPRRNSVRQRWGGAEPASERSLLHLPPRRRRRVIMAMATSRLLWASRAASYLKISTFPRAFSTGTSPFATLPAPFIVRACISCLVPRVPRDHG